MRPESPRLKAIYIAHEGHQGLVKTKQLLRGKVWYPGKDQLAKHTGDICWLCEVNGPNSPQESLRMTTLLLEPWHTVNVEFCGLFPLICLLSLMHIPVFRRWKLLAQTNKITSRVVGKPISKSSKAEGGR